MGKLQPNFSWQKYEGKPEDQKEQFQYQLQTQHIQVANSVNATIDDLSYWSRERMTSETWVDNRPIWRKTVSGTIAVAPGDNAVNHGITGIRQVVNLYGTAQDATPMSAFGFPLCYVDPATPANGIGLFSTPTQVVVRTGSAAWANYIFYVTIFYTKT
jgi:hypothetical protein